MKENCAECRHHDVFWGGAGCNLLNNGERCKFEPLHQPAEGRRMNKKAVLISVRPKWCEMIANGEKTVEVRKTRPKLKTPFKVYIYCTKSDDMFWVLNTISRRVYGFSAVCANLKDAEGAYEGNGKVIGEFVCDTILRNCEMANADIAEAQSCVKREKILEYSGGHEVFGWHVSDLVIYDKPKELSEFDKPMCTRESDCGAGCSYFDPDLVICKRETTFKRPPQSWCYVK